jgi:hypothetical protein
VGRVIAGLCVGIASSIVPVYQSEIAPKEIRGRVVSLQQWAITWGILIQYGLTHFRGYTRNKETNFYTGTSSNMELQMSVVAQMTQTNPNRHSVFHGVSKWCEAKSSLVFYFANS